jgi:inositol oxygenase
MSDNKSKNIINDEPLSRNMEEWEEFLESRYSTEKSKEEYRIYDENTDKRVQDFYRINHRNQTYDFVLGKKKEFLSMDRKKMGVWEAAEFLNTLVDESDPDTELSQLEHLLQTSESIRADGHPDWFVLAGFMHDLGKILVLYGEPQWAVVGDTFPVGCKFSDEIVYPEYFRDNPDINNVKYNSKFGVYEEGCGLDNVHLSWGHDEYLYNVVKDYLPEPALYMIRYHSFYPWHRHGAYQYLMNENDREMLEWVQKFNPYDLYSKTPNRPVVSELRPYYEVLINKYFPDKLDW